MAGARYTLTVDDAELRGALRRLLGATDDPAPALRVLGERLLRSTRERFGAGNKRAPDGTPWARNAPSTIARKGRDNPLYQRGLLQGQLRYQLTADGRGVEVGSGLVYAATQQFGAGRGQFGSTARGAPIPWGTIPARPYLGLSEADRAMAVETLRDFLRRALG